MCYFFLIKMVNYILYYEDNTVVLNLTCLETADVVDDILKRFPELNAKKFKIQQYIGEDIKEFIDIDEAVNGSGSNKLKIKVLPKSEYRPTILFDHHANKLIFDPL